jgi:lipoteichoic acid synthase
MNNCGFAALGVVMVDGLTAIYSRMTKKAVFLGYMATFTMIVIAGFITQMEIAQNGDGLLGVFSIAILFDRFLMELIVVLLFGVLFLDRNWILRFWLYLLSTSFMVVYVVQLVSFYQGREYLSRLAIDNINHLSFLITTKSIIGGTLLLLLCILLPFLIERKEQDPPMGSSLVKFSAFILIASAFMLHQSDRWLSVKMVKHRDKVFQDNYMKHAAPIYALYKTLFSGGVDISQEGLDREFREHEIKEIEKFGFAFKKGAEYPVIKETIYTYPSPFPVFPNAHKKPNIIIVFTEGFSARAMHSYGSKYDDVTPYLDDFSQQSMIVDNYYNHTAATYRGLHGQNCSIFPFYGGVGGWQTNYKNLPETEYLCLPQFFKERRYETVFLDAHKKETSHVDEMVSQLGYNTVITGRELSREYLNNAPPVAKRSLSDGQFFNSLVGYLRSREESGKVGKPFFMGLYNLGTHAFEKLTNDGKQYKDGENNSLNTIHNLDYAFGLFWEYFKKSPYYKNTIVIFTADHCHYPEKPFVKAFKEKGYQKLFIDKIPLVIYDPTRNLPKRFDAKNATSIDFAPSLIHYLELGNRRNPFMGSSIYDKKRKSYDRFGVGSYGKNLFLIDDVKIHKFGFSSKYFSKMMILQRYIHESKKLEIENRLWKTKSKSK